MSESSLAASLSTLSEAVRTSAEQRAHQQRLAAQRETTGALVTTREEELASLARALDVERDEVRRLEQLSPTKIWATLRGNAADRLATERAEAEAAALAVAAAQSRLERAVAEHSRVRREHAALGATEVAYQEALAAYEAALTSAGGTGAAELGRLAEEAGLVTERGREVQEAVAALGATRRALDVALEKLASAGGWSTYDTFFGGGLVGDIVKHSKIDAATEAFRDVNRELEHLSVELADIGESTVDGVDISQTLAVFDVLFDNVFSDWMVRNRIAEARDKAEDLRSRLALLAVELDDAAGSVASQLAELARRREEILTGS